jgi:hypothetical protein
MEVPSRLISGRPCARVTRICARRFGIERGNPQIAIVIERQRDQPLQARIAEHRAPFRHGLPIGRKIRAQAGRPG